MNTVDYTQRALERVFIDLLTSKLNGLMNIDNIKNGPDVLDYLLQFSLSDDDEKGYNKKLAKLNAKQEKMEYKYTPEWLDKDKQYNELFEDIRRIQGELSRNRFAIMCDVSKRKEIIEESFSMFNFNYDEDCYEAYGLKIFFVDVNVDDRIFMTNSTNVVFAYEDTVIEEIVSAGGRVRVKTALEFMYHDAIKEIIK